MPERIKRRCLCRSCNALHRNANGYCDEHKAQASGWTKREQHKGNRHQRGYGNEWTKLRIEILRRDKNLCQPCMRAGRLTEAHAVDHIKPKAKGGTDEPRNLEAICKACHAAKTQREARG